MVGYIFSHVRTLSLALISLTATGVLRAFTVAGAYVTRLIKIDFFSRYLINSVVLKVVLKSATLYGSRLGS